MYELKQNLKQPLEEGFGEDKEEKRRCSVNLFEFQWKALDLIVKNKSFSSRNELLRKILRDYLATNNQ